MLKKCLICGKEFKVANWNKERKFCCKKCQFIAQKKEKIIKKCQMCGKIFEVLPYQKESKYCSNKCFYESRIDFKYGNKIKEYKNYAVLIIESKKFGTIDVLIDKKNIEKVKKYTWCLTHSKRGNFYIMTKIKNKTLKLHRYLTNCPNNMVVDHINHNTLDNREKNLRVCTNTENIHNFKIMSNKTGFTYIYIFFNNRYRFSINRNGIKFTKYFPDLLQAINFRNTFLQENFNKLDINKNTFVKILNQKLNTV